MSILKQLWTAMKGATTEAGEAIVDHQAIRILEQEVRDSKKALNEAKSNLTKIMAEKMTVGRKVEQLNKDVVDHENYAGKALDQGNDSLALEIAEKIAELVTEQEIQTKLLNDYENNINKLKKTIKTTERNIQALDRELAVVKTTESVQKANQAAAAQFSGSNSAMRSATDSLSRIREKQQKRTDRMNAASELHDESGDNDLQSKMKAAGIAGDSNSANDILAKLKSNRAG